jgi:hypothetical protein
MSHLSWDNLVLVWLRWVLVDCGLGVKCCSWFRAMGMDKAMACCVISVGFGLLFSKTHLFHDFQIFQHR